MLGVLSDFQLKWSSPLLVKEDRSQEAKNAFFAYYFERNAHLMLSEWVELWKLALLLGVVFGDRCIA